MGVVGGVGRFSESPRVTVFAGLEHFVPEVLRGYRGSMEQ